MENFKILQQGKNFVAVFSIRIWFEAGE